MQTQVSPKHVENRAEGLRTYVVVNPASAAGATRQNWRAVEGCLRKNLDHFEVAFTEAPVHATELARSALKAGYEQVVAVGGDGTVNEVANGFFEDDRPIAPHAVLGIVARGTGSDFVRSVYKHNDLESACARLAGHRSRILDAGHVRFLAHHGEPESRIFLNVMSFGIGGDVAKRMKRSKKLGGKLGYKLVSARTLLGFKDQSVKARIDDGPFESFSVTNFAVANARYHGGGMMVAPNAKPDDGLFDLRIWSGFGFLDFILHQSKLYNGTHVALKGSEGRLATHLHVESSMDVNIEIDGEAPGQLPIQIKMLPSAIRLKI